MDICVVSTFLASWITLLWTFVYTFLCGYMCSLLYLVVELLSRMATLCLFLVFWPCRVKRRILVPWPGIKLVLPAWEHEVLTAGLPGKSTLCLTFWGIAKLFSKVLYCLIFPPAIYDSFTFSALLQMCIVFLIATLVDLKWYFIVVLIY